MLIVRRPARRVIQMRGSLRFHNNAVGAALKLALTLAKAVVLTAFVVYGVVDLSPSVFTRGFSALLGLPTPVASARYKVRVLNSTSIELIATVYILNDLPFKVDSWWVKRQRDLAGWIDQKAVSLSPGAAAEIVLPSKLEPRIGSILVVARSKICDAGGTHPTQRIAAILATWKQGGFVEVPILDADLQEMGIGHSPLQVRPLR